MTGIAAIAGPGASSVDAMLATFAGLRADGPGASESSAGVALGAARSSWEDALTPGAALVANERAIVVADATLYYVDELARQCADHGVAPRDRGAADLILAAYGAFGDECLQRLVGDFAFILWDRARQRLLAARDFSGKRPLFHALAGDALVVASSARSVLAAPGMRRDVDLGVVASVASGSWTHTDETAWIGVRELRAGHALVRERDGLPRTFEWWRAPMDRTDARVDTEEGAVELRRLLVAATRERLAPVGTTAVSLSGGWDSTAVYASAQHVLRSEDTAQPPRRIAAVSISYPEGDPGREDELIGAVTGHWQASSRLLPVDEIGMFADAERAAARRDHPMAHTYERWNRALYDGARAEGARVMLDGLGGDQLFQVSDIFLSDLVRRGQWRALWRQYRAKAQGQGDLRSLYRWALRPLLPWGVLRAIARVRRTAPPRHYLDRRPSSWFRRDFLDRHDVEGRERQHRPRLPRGDAVRAESHAFLKFPFYPRIIGMLHTFALEQGVELRSPLLDERVVRFALSRPWHERSNGAETKVLLRRSMRGLLPEHVLAPRPRRTGVTSAYFLRQMRGPGRPLVEGMLMGDSRLADAGMIDPRRLQRSWERVLRYDDDDLAGRIFFTLQAELWLRGRGHP